MTQEPKWTPGPWDIHEMDSAAGWKSVLDGSFTYLRRNIGAGRCLVAELTAIRGVQGGYPRATTTEQLMANARLVAAAPEMYEALESLVNQSNGCTCTFPASDCCSVARARAAIAKARGESR